MMSLQSGLSDVISMSMCIGGLGFFPVFFFSFSKPCNNCVLGSSVICCHFVKPQLQSSTTYKETEVEIKLFVFLSKLMYFKDTQTLLTYCITLSNF